MATMSSAEFLKFIDTIHHKDIDTVVDELDDRVLSGWIDWASQPIKFAEDGEPIKVDDENDADYISNPSCIMGVYTSDEDVFYVEISLYNKMDVDWEDFMAIVFQYREWHNKIPNLRKDLASELGLKYFVESVNVVKH